VSVRQIQFPEIRQPLEYAEIGVRYPTGAQIDGDDAGRRIPGHAAALGFHPRGHVAIGIGCRQKRKQDEVQHPVVDQKVLLGLVPHVQARLLARHLRGDLEHYPPYLYR